MRRHRARWCDPAAAQKATSGGLEPSDRRSRSRGRTTTRKRLAVSGQAKGTSCIRTARCQNRTYLFRLPEYGASRHFLGIGNIRCLTDDVAVADGKWDLREVLDGNRKLLPPMDGLCTLVLKRSLGNWAIEAYRYTITPRAGPTPTVLKQPGFIR